MALPLPRVVPDVGPGGGLVTAMGGINALKKKMLETKMQELRNQYYAPDIQSQINNRNSLTKGQDIQNEYMPDKLKLSNELAQLKNKNYEPNIQSEINNRNALTNRYNTMTPLQAEELGIKNKYMPERLMQEAEKRDYFLKNPQNNKSFAPTNELKNAQFFQDAKAGYIPNTNRTQKVESPEQQKFYMDAFSAKNPHKIIEEHQQKLLARKHWDSLPSETKSHLVAIAQGAGIRGDEVEKELSSGKSFDDILYSHGYDPKHPPEAIYELTKSNQKSLNEREYASKEVKYLSDFINKATGDYASKVREYSPSQVKDALLGKNEEQQAKFLAARALSPELINLRLLLGGAKGTVHAIKSMGEKSMLNNKVFESLVSNKVWHRTQEIMDRELQKAFLASKKGYGQPKEIKNNNKNKIDKEIYDVPEGYVGLFKKGEQYFFPQNLVNKKLNEGYSYE